MGGPSETRSDRLAVRLNVGKRYACHDVRRRVSEGPPVSPALHAVLGPRSRAAKDARGIDRRSRPTSRQRVVGRLGARNLFRPHTKASPLESSIRPLSTAERAGGAGGALGNPSSYVETGVPATDRRAVGQTVRSGFPRPHPPHPPRGSAAIGSPQF